MEIFAPCVGVSFRGKEAVALVKSLTPDDGERLSLEADPDNEYDDHAVKILCDGVFIGFVARENNARIFEALQAGTELNVQILNFENTIKPVLLIRDFVDEEDGAE